MEELARLLVDHLLAQAVAGLAVDLVERDLLGVRRRRIEGDRTAFFRGGTYRAVFLNLLAQSFADERDHERTAKVGQESLRLNRQAGDVQGIAWSLLNLAMASEDSGDYEQAEGFYAEGLSLARESDSAYHCFDILFTWGWSLLVHGDLQQATKLTEEAVELARERGRGFKGMLPRAINNLSWATLLLRSMM